MDGPRDVYWSLPCSYPVLELRSVLQSRLIVGQSIADLSHVQVKQLTLGFLGHFQYGPQ